VQLIRSLPPLYLFSHPREATCEKQLHLCFPDSFHGRQTEKSLLSGKMNAPVKSWKSNGHGKCDPYPCREPDPFQQDRESRFLLVD
jgi:hypothetical protein